jgi:pSer/pThr/pTyr-binding forkhead associated (FHA) protein
MDMGSSNGTYVNGHPVPLSKGVKLAEGDRILTGRCRLVYAPLPDWVIDPDPNEPHTVSVLITHIGKSLGIDGKSEIVIGRPDANLGYTPDIDLSVAGDVAAYVSRRHVRLVKRDGLHYLEDLGSAAGTRVNGSRIHSGAPPLLLHHGDQIWLGGCVLAYEWKLTRGVSQQ